MTFTIEPTSPTEAVIIMSRTFDAPREKVWAALTTPEHVVRWFGGEGFENPVCEMDVRPGGRWHHVMRLPDGMEITIDYVYIEVTPPEKLVWQHVDYGLASEGPPRSNNTVTLEDRGEVTGWRMVARFTSLADRDAATHMGFGEILRQGCERVAAVIATL